MSIILITSLRNMNGDATGRVVSIKNVRLRMIEWWIANILTEGK